MFQEFEGIGGITEGLQKALEPLMSFHVEIVEIRRSVLL